MVQERENGLSKEAIQAAIEVHRELGGPGLLESVYESALCYELKTRGLDVQRQLSVPVRYKGQVIAEPLKVDLLLENSLVIEIKATSEHHKIFESQLLTYLRLMSLELGLILNFGFPTLKQGIHRVVNNRLYKAESFFAPDPV